jgi:P pilus assembly chaperone PapD
MKLRKTLAYFIVIFLAISLLVPFGVLAKVGVGVGTGKIELDKPAKPGGLYTLPPLTVVNTGDEAADYGAKVEYQQDQPRMSPPKEWFVFMPDKFHLEPGQSQIVKVQLSIPIKATPGDYFAFLEGYPAAQSDTPGGATIGIAAAAKMYFTVAPANIFQGIYYRLASIIKNNAPWSYVFLIIVAMSVVVVLFKRHFSFNIGISRKSDAKLGDDKK